METMSRDILLSKIDPDPEQPRKHFDAAKLQELAASMDANGLAVPLLVRPAGDRFVIVHGERRYRAALSLNWSAIRAEIRDVTSEEAAWLALAENIQRADLTPIEEAQAYRERLSKGITQAELGQRIGKSQSYIAQKLRLLKLPEDVQAAIDSGGITEGHARQLLRVKDADTQSALCQRAVGEGWTVARARLEVDEALKPKRPTTPAELIIYFWERRGRVAAHDPYPEERMPESYNPPVEIRKLPIAEIDELDWDVRTERDLKYPEWLAEIFVVLPPIAVYRVGGRYILVDGKYRMMAAQLLGLQEIECRIYESDDLRDVDFYAAAANAGGGLPFTPREREKMVQRWNKFQDSKTEQRETARDVLNESERRELQECEAVIEAGLPELRRLGWVN